MIVASAYTPTDSGWGLWFLVAVVVLATVAVGVAWIARRIAAVIAEHRGRVQRQIINKTTVMAVMASLGEDAQTSLGDGNGYGSGNGYGYGNGYGW